MLKTGTRLFFLLMFTAALGTNAQTTDTVKKDTVKIDTTILNKYRIQTKKNAIPVPPTPIQIQQELIPVTMLDYKISYWRKYITFGLNFSQAAFSDNYAAGGVTAVALTSNFIYRIEYNKAPFSYTSELNLLYGKSKNKGQSSRKSNDRIFFDNKIATQMSKHWFFFGSLTFESQFDTGYQYDGAGVNPPILISNFMAPGYLTESIGFEYKPTSYFDLRLGTGTARQTFVLDDNVFNSLAPGVDELYGVKRGKSIRTDIAFQMVAIFDKDIAKNMHLNARYDVFVPYGQDLSFTRHRFDAILAAKVNRLVNVSINGTILFDKKSKPGVQATEGLALGVLYKFP
ncbi:DUF3078 domain-containing protein [Mucilaginibacter sp. RB4R14]|uniref:DUF3078 domain-containing protein n=1 Tax=Mucilaginibacter aurantiaciroseus TaxID=2949308 RepID=UPI0020903C72|nr:DUF3078 domain-containing protein [Mucilaginibacter aurantiaciroseus]MCO5936777.1 DUF3078 domain-containing protein [Mucilaginibacter aurantiaciroseus]